MGGAIPACAIGPVENGLPVVSAAGTAWVGNSGGVLASGAGGIDGETEGENDGAGGSAGAN